jgi:hypothetical protein
MRYIEIEFGSERIVVISSQARSLSGSSLRGSHLSIVMVIVIRMAATVLVLDRALDSATPKVCMYCMCVFGISVLS